MKHRDRERPNYRVEVHRLSSWWLDADSLGEQVGREVAERLPRSWSIQERETFLVKLGEAMSQPQPALRAEAETIAAVTKVAASARRFLIALEGLTAEDLSRVKPLLGELQHMREHIGKLPYSARNSALEELLNRAWESARACEVVAEHAERRIKPTRTGKVTQNAARWTVHRVVEAHKRTFGTVPKSGRWLSEVIDVLLVRQSEILGKRVTAGDELIRAVLQERRV